jgi:hypothetical protein
VRVEAKCEVYERKDSEVTYTRQEKEEVKVEGCVTGNY